MVEKFRADRQMVISSVFSMITLLVPSLMFSILSFLPFLVNVKSDYNVISLILSGSIFGAIALATTVLLIIRAIVIYKNYEFYLEGSNICMSKGFFAIKKTVLPIENFHTLNKKRNLANLLSNSMTICIDSGSRAGSTTEQFHITLQKDKCLALYDNLQDLIQKVKVGDDENLKLDFLERLEVINAKVTIEEDLTSQKLPLSSFIISSIFQIKGFLIFCGFLAVYSALYLTKSSYINNLAKYFWVTFPASLASSYFITIVIQCLTYSHFVIKINGDNLNLSYGIVHQKSYDIPLEKINAITFKQNIFYQLIGRYDMRLSVLGFGFTEGKYYQPLMAFCIRKKMSEEIIAKFLPKYNQVKERTIAPKKAILHYCVLLNLVFYVLIGYIGLVAMILVNELAIVILSLIGGSYLLIHTHSLLAYIRSKIKFNENSFTITRGGFYSNTAIIAHDSVQSISRMHGPIKKAQSLSKIEVIYYDNLLGGKISVSHFSDDDYYKMNDILYANSEVATI